MTDLNNVKNGVADKQHAYDPDLPYVVEGPVGSEYLARFSYEGDASLFLDALPYPTRYRVIDTTPKPRVPEDARFITWEGNGFRYTAFRNLVDRWNYAPDKAVYLEDLPGVTPDTVFTVLQERKS